MRWLMLLVMATASAAWAAEPKALLTNGDFETPKIAAGQTPAKPEGWNGFASGPALTEKLTLSAAKAHGGEQALRLSALAVKDGFSGVTQMATVEAGKTYRLTAFVLNDATQPLAGSLRGQISLEWKDAAGKEIDRTWGPDCGGDLSQQQWRRLEMTAKAPAGAAKVNVAVTLHEGPAPQAGALFVDDVNLEMAE